MRSFRLLIALAYGVLSTLAAAMDVTPIRASEHSWYVAGKPGMASAANQGFMSNAGFVITDDTDWSAWERMPAFREANRLDAYNVFLQIEQELLD